MRAVVQRQERLRERVGQRVEPPAGAGRQHEALHSPSQLSGCHPAGFYHGDRMFPAIMPCGGRDDSRDRQAPRSVVLHHRDAQPARRAGRGGAEPRASRRCSPRSSASSTRATSRSLAPMIERLCAEAGIRLDYVHPAPRGLTRPAQHRHRADDRRPGVPDRRRRLARPGRPRGDPRRVRAVGPGAGRRARRPGRPPETGQADDPLAQRVRDRRAGGPRAAGGCDRGSSWRACRPRSRCGELEYFERVVHVLPP